MVFIIVRAVLIQCKPLCCPQVRIRAERYNYREPHATFVARYGRILRPDRNGRNDRNGRILRPDHPAVRSDTCRSLELSEKDEAAVECMRGEATALCAALAGEAATEIRAWQCGSSKVSAAVCCRLPSQSNCPLLPTAPHTPHCTPLTRTPHCSKQLPTTPQRSPSQSTLCCGRTPHFTSTFRSSCGHNYTCSSIRN